MQRHCAVPIGGSARGVISQFRHARLLETPRSRNNASSPPEIINMPDDILGLGKATSEALSLLKDPVKALCGPAYEQLAGAWGDKARHWREMRQLNLALEAVRQIRAKGLEPKAVAPSLFFPIVENRFTGRGR
jgi:hypothetical protein